MPSYDTHVYDTTKLTRVRRRVSSWRSLSDSVSWSTDRKSTRLNSSHLGISYAVFCLKKNIGDLAHENRHAVLGADDHLFEIAGAPDQAEPADDRSGPSRLSYVDASTAVDYHDGVEQ